MAIASLPAFYDMPYTDEKGALTADAHLYNDEMFQTLDMAVFLLNTLVSSSINSTNGTVSNLGVKFPQYTTAQIATLAADADIGTVWFDTDVAKLKVLTDDDPVTIETIQSV